MATPPIGIDAQPGAVRLLADELRAGQVEAGRRRLEIHHQHAALAETASQLGQRAVEHQPAVVDHDHPLAQLLHVAQVVRGEDHGGAALPVDRADEPADALLGHHVQADGRLVQEQERRIVQQRGGQVGAHALAQAQAAHGRIQERAQLQQVVEQAQVVLVAIFRHAVDVVQQVQRLDHGQIPPQAGALAEHHADAPDVLGALPPRHAAVHLHLAAGGHQDAGQDLDRGGLARAVRAEIAHQLARRDIEADAVHRGHHVWNSRVDQIAQRAQRAAMVPVDAEVLVQSFDSIMSIHHDVSFPCSDNRRTPTRQAASASRKTSSATSGDRNGIQAGSPNGSGLPSR